MPKINDREKFYIGIDPGKSGGIAIIDSRVTFTRPMPSSERGIWEVIAVEDNSHTFAVIEKVHAMPKQGVTSMFTFGVGYGGLRMALIAAGIPFEEVTPQKWQKSFGMVRKKSELNSVWKRRLMAKAQQLFPLVDVTLKTADALLIAEYARRTY